MCISASVTVSVSNKTYFVGLWSLCQVLATKKKGDNDLDCPNL